MPDLLPTYDLEEAIAPMLEVGYERDQLAAFQTWLDRGDDVLVFRLADLGAVATHVLVWAMPWERHEPTPRQAPDTDQCGLGWRYLPHVRVTA